MENLDNIKNLRVFTLWDDKSIKINNLDSTEALVRFYEFAENILHEFKKDHRFCEIDPFESIGNEPITKENFSEYSVRKVRVQ